MIHGVAKSQVFILFAASDTLSRPFVALESETAKRFEKIMIVLYETDLRHSAALNEDGKFDVEKVFFNAETSQRSPGGKPTPPEIKEYIRNLPSTHFIPYMRRANMQEAALKTAMECAGIPVEPVTVLKAAPGMACLVVHAAMAMEHASNLSARLARRGIDMPSDVEACSFVVLLLTDGFFLDPVLVAMVRKVKQLNISIVLVTEGSRFHGGALNAMLTFDFSRVFGEQAPDDLKDLPSDLEAIPFMGEDPHPRFGEAMVDMVVDQANHAVAKKEEAKVTARRQRASSRWSFAPNNRRIADDQANAWPTAIVPARAVAVGERSSDESDAWEEASNTKVEDASRSESFSRPQHFLEQRLARKRTDDEAAQQAGSSALTLGRFPAKPLSTPGWTGGVSLDAADHDQQMERRRPSLQRLHSKRKEALTIAQQAIDAMAETRKLEAAAAEAHREAAEAAKDVEAEDATPANADDIPSYFS